jgi:hypothetical protein
MMAVGAVRLAGNSTIVMNEGSYNLANQPDWPDSVAKPVNLS